MAKPKPKCHLVAYYLRPTMTKETFSAFWAQMARRPFEARKFGDVERMKLQFSRDAEARAYRLLDLGVLLVRGKGLSYFVTDNSSIDRFMLDIEPSAMGESSRQQWIEWFVELFDGLSVVFASGCLDTEFYAKHTVEFQLPDGTWHSETRGFRPPDFKTCLPGVYWFNYYGSEIGEHLGERILANDQLAVTDLGRNRFVALLKEPLTPVDLADRLARERQVAEEIGGDYFFDKESPPSRKQQVPGLAVLLRSLAG